ncbi:urease accessory protein UreF [Rhizobium sp. PAMB 3174]
MPNAAGTQSLLRLMTWLSPAFPVGAFAYSAGLENAAGEGRVKDGDGLADWISLSITSGPAWNDAVLLAESFRRLDDPASLEELAELAAALAGSAERYRETRLVGEAFLEAAGAWPQPALDHLPADAPYPVAVGVVAAANGVDLTAALAAYLHAAASQAVSAGIRLSLCGQRQGVAILAALEPLIGATAEKAAHSTIDALGSATFFAEISSLRHETQMARLFRS